MEAILDGCYDDLPNPQYHAAYGLSKSMLDSIAVSPRKFWYDYINPNREPEERKDYFAIGDGTHKLVLEPGTFEKTYCVGFDKSAYPDALDTIADMKAELTRLGLMVSGSKPELAERLFEAEFPRNRIMYYLEQDHVAKMNGRIKIDARAYKSMLHMLEAVNEHHTASALIRGAYVEHSYFTTDTDGRVRKCRPDIITNDGRIIADLKTTDDVSLAGFGYKIFKFRYHVQAAWYLDILKMLYGSDAPRTFAFIAVEKDPPYDVAVHYLDEADIEIGRQLYQRDLALYDQCRLQDYWPGKDFGKVFKAQLPAKAYYL